MPSGKNVPLLLGLRAQESRRRAGGRLFAGGKEKKKKKIMNGGDGKKRRCYFQIIRRCLKYLLLGKSHQILISVKRVSRKATLRIGVSECTSAKESLFSLGKATFF